MKKIVTILLSTCMLLCVVVGLVACGDKECSHSYSATNVTNPTCTEQGYTTFTCDKCGDSYDTYFIDTIAHTYGEKIVIKEPSCTENGQSKEVCTVCTFEKITTENSTGHSFENGFCSKCSATDKNSSALIDGTEINNLSITEQGVLSWAKMKIASKYTLEINTSGGAKTIEIKKEDAYVDLSSVSDLILDYGNNPCVITIYEWQTYEEEIDGETIKIEEHIPVEKKSFNVVNLNSGKSISILQFEDDRISADGFHSEYYKNDVYKYLFSEVVLANKNASVSYRIDKQIKLSEGCKIAFYASRYDRDNGQNPLGNIAISTQKVKAGNNWFFANVIDGEGNVYAYDFLVMGITYAELFVAEFDRTLDDSGNYIPSYNYLTLENDKVLQNGYIDINAIYELIPDGYTLRDNEWNIYERNGDYIVPVKESFSLYYAPNEEILAEKAEIDAYKQWFDLTLYMDGYEKTPDKWILSVHSKSLIKSLVIPHRIIGNEVVLSSSSFYNAKLSTVTIAPGYTSLPDRLFSSVESLSTLNIPSTVTSLGDWMFNAKFADTLKIYCESSISNGHWNQISGTTRYFTTYINATGAASSTIRDGYTARITQDGAYIVSCVNGTTTPIPKSVFFGIIEYPVVGLYEGALNNYAGEKLFIDKGITTLFPTSFNRNIAVITVDEENPNYVSKDGILYNKDLSSIIFVPYKVSGNITLPIGVTSLAEGQFKDRTMLTGINTTNVTTIPKEAFYGCTALTHVVLPSVVNINDYAFYGCADVDTLTISSVDISFGSLVFGKATIQTFNYAGNAIDWSQVSIATFNSNPVSCSNKVIFAGSELSETITIFGVSKISDYVFENAKITSVILSDDVKTIGKYAFCGKYIKTLDLGNGVKEIGNSAFLGAQITDLTLPTTLKTIGEQAFSNTKITSLEITNEVTNIGTEAFKNCELLTKLVVRSNTVKIGENAFLNTNVTEFGCRVVPEGIDVSKIETLILVKPTITQSDKYTNYKSLTKIVVSNTVTAIGEKTFENLKTMEEVVFEANSNLSTIGQSAFSGCTALIGVYISDVADWCNITFDSAYANPLKYANDLYLNNILVTDLNLPDSVTAIKDYTFNGAGCLQRVKIPAKTSSISTLAFSDCTELAAIEVAEDNDYFSCDSGIIYDIRKTSIIYAPQAISDDIVIPDTVTVIGDNAFLSCSRLTGVTMGKDVTSIGNSAFKGCSSLTSITIPDGVTSIGSSAFEGCPIETAKVPSRFCSYINNQKLKTVVITSGTSISNSAFKDCSSLTSITIPDGVTSIGSSAFKDCSSLTNITIPDKITSIGNSTFSGCSSLTTITIPDKVTSIGNYAFYRCSSLTNITIPDKVTSIGNYAFNDCSKLSSITIPAGVTAIGDSTFFSCGNLTSITIPNSVTSISKWAFRFCSKLTTINFNGTKAQWNAIKKDSYWKENAWTTVYCTDGNLSVWS